MARGRPCDFLTRGWKQAAERPSGTFILLVMTIYEGKKETNSLNVTATVGVAERKIGE
jgi:hypothetical protein